MSSKRPLLFLVFVAALLAMIVVTIREQQTIRAFDAGYGKLLDRLSAAVQNTIEDRERLDEFYDLLKTSREELKALPPVRNEVRLVLRGRLEQMLENLPKFREENPLEAGSDELLGQVASQLAELKDCLSKGIPWPEDEH